MMNIPVVFCIDKNYIMPLKVAIHSLLENRGESTRYLIYIIISDDISKMEQDSISKSFLNYSGYSIEFLLVDNLEKYIDSAHFSTMSAYSYSIFYRLFLHKLLPAEIDKCIYCDCDIVIDADLSKLYTIEIGSNLFAAERDAFVCYVDIDNCMYLQKSYVNSGILLINNKLWREERIDNQVIPLMGRKFRFPDQDILNIIAEKRIYYFPDKEYVEDLPYENISPDNKIIKHTIIHFNSFLKPWNTAVNHPYYLLWEHFADKAGYGSIVIRNRSNRKCFEEYIKKNEINKILIWGAMVDSLYAAFVLESYGIEVIGFADNNSNKNGMKYYKYFVYEIEQVREMKDIHIVIMPRAVMPIVKQLNKVGFSKNRILLWVQLWLMILTED